MRSKAWHAPRRNSIERRTESRSCRLRSLEQGDQVDLSTEAVALLQSKNSFEANTKVVKVADQMDRTLLDMMG